MPRPATTPSAEPAWLLAAVEPQDLDLIASQYRQEGYDVKFGLFLDNVRALYWRPAA